MSRLGDTVNHLVQAVSGYGGTIKNNLTGTAIKGKLGVSVLTGANTGDEDKNTILGKLGLTNLTGSNTGDETAATIKTKLGITTLSGANTGDETQTTILNKLNITSISGVNTGDETNATIKSKLGITTLSGSNTGDETNASILSKLSITSISGTNTGDETAATIKTKLGITTLSGSNTGDETNATLLSKLSAPNGIATLDATLKVPKTQLPANTAYVDTAQTFTKSQRGQVVALAYAASIALDLSLSNNYSLTLTGNGALAAPTNAVAGQSGVIAVSQDTTGGRTLTYNAVYKFVGGTPPVLTTTGSAVDYLFYYVESPARIFITSALNIK